MERWFEELDFDNNPFDTNPLKAAEFIGHSGIKDEVIYRIISGNMLFIEGPPETGKTTLLKFAIDNFKGNGKVIYVNCKKMEKDLNITNLVFGNIGWLDKLRGKKPKNMILLLDEIQFLTKKNSERIKNLYDHNYIKAVIFTSKNFSKVNFTPSLKQRIGRRIIKLKGLTEYDAVEIIRSRIGEHNIISDNMIKKIFKKSNGSAKELLINCEKACKAAVDEGELTVLDRHLDVRERSIKEKPKEDIIRPDNKDEGIIDEKEIVKTKRSKKEEPIIEILDDEKTIEVIEEPKKAKNPDSKEVNIVYEQPKVIMGPKDDEDIAEKYY